MSGDSILEFSVGRAKSFDQFFRLFIHAQPKPVTIRWILAFYNNNEGMERVMQGRRIRIVHISDLHLGKDSANLWRVRRVLGEVWKKNLMDIARDGTIDLVCFTGDVAQAGQASQYEEATVFVRETLELLKVPLDRFFCVPGNHDVDRNLHKEDWRRLREGVEEIGAQGVTDWLAGGQAPRGFEAGWLDNTLARQAAYQQWLRNLGRQELLPQANPHGRLGYRATIDLDLEAPLHLIGLDSAWLAGDNNDASKLILTDGQIGRLCTQVDGRRLDGWCVAMLHHPIGDLADGSNGRRLLAEHGVSLLLHGHLHDPELARWETPSQGLHISAAGCLYEHDRFPNSLQVLDIELPALQPARPHQLWSRAWSARGHWHNDDGCYPNSVNGRLLLIPQSAPTLLLATDKFVGRDTQLDALKRALLPPEGQAVQAALVCCAIEGMPGVGKTRLAEEFVTRHWLPHWGLDVLPGLADHVVRLILSPTDPAPSAEQLGQTVADRLRLPGNKDSLWQRVGDAMRYGPAGKPRLLWVDNVDTQALASAVAPLGHHLKGCALLVTARFQRLGSTGWQRVPVQPMDEAEAIQLLFSQLDNQGASVNHADARELVRRLGGLPLALHIAASHLNLGHTPRSFLAELQKQGLGLPPADAADPALLTDYARAVIRHSFNLSWQHWCAHQPAAWQQALSVLAHGPAAELGPDLAASVAGLTDEEWERMAPQATRLSLLQTDALTRRASLHPLIAEFLRGQADVDAVGVRNRLSAWFLPRLPATGDERQGQSWSAVWAETPALAHWLSLLPLQEGLEVERAAKELAVLQGPFGIWRSFLEGLLAQKPDPKHLSNLYWTLTHVVRYSGDMDIALAYAQRKFEVDQARMDARGQVLARGAQADILQARGQLDEALRIRREEELPVFESLGDMREKAITVGKIADILQARGQFDEALRIYREEQLPVYERLGDVRSKAATMGQIADILQVRGQFDEALRILSEEVRPVFEFLGDVRAKAVTIGKIGDILQDRGQLDEALRIRREEQLPVYERLGDVRAKAITVGKIADILQARGQLDEALRILSEDVRPAFERLGDVRAKAVTMGKIADILQARDQFDEALRIRREEELPVYERLRDVRAKAVTMGKISDILQARGQLDEALQILSEEVRPAFERLGDVRAKAVTMGKIGDILQDRGQLDEALRIRREEELPVYERLRDVRSKATTMGKISDILQARGQPDEALRILSEEVRPAFERLGDVHAKAVTMGKIGDILQARGQLDEALRIRREEELPVYERLGDMRAKAVTMGNVADILKKRGQLDEALRIRREEELPVYERLGDMHALLVARTNLAQIYAVRGHDVDRPEIESLLRAAHAAAQEIRLPEAEQIARIYKRIFGHGLDKR